MLSLQPITLTDFLLSRLLFIGMEGMVTSDLKRSFKAILGSELSNSVLTERIETALVALSEQGYIQSVSRSRYQITDAGRQHILNQLGLETLPLKLQWNTFKNADWIAYALKLPPLLTETRKRIADADGLRASILKHCFDLPIKDFVTLTQARNALLWQKLCDPETAKNLQQQLPELRQQSFNQGAVMGALLNDLLQAHKPLPWSKALPQLVAKVANARRTTPDELRIAILRQALVDITVNFADQSYASSQTLPPEKTVVAAPPSTPTLSNAKFAEIILKAAKDTQDGRLGDSKVFISRVWETLQQQHPELKLTQEEFKQRLVDANQQRLLTLSRADLAYALDPEDVSVSEINHLNSTFHFIRLD